MNSQISQSTVALRQFQALYLCPINMTIMKQPFRLPCQHVFEEEAIRKYFQRKNECPLCRKQCRLEDGSINLLIKQSIEVYENQLKRKQENTMKKKKEDQKRPKNNAGGKQIKYQGNQSRIKDKQKEQMVNRQKQVRASSTLRRIQYPREIGSLIAFYPRGRVGSVRVENYQRVEPYRNNQSSADRQWRLDQEREEKERRLEQQRQEKQRRLQNEREQKQRRMEERQRMLQMQREQRQRIQEEKYERLQRQRQERQLKQERKRERQERKREQREQRQERKKEQRQLRQQMLQMEREERQERLERERQERQLRKQRQRQQREWRREQERQRRSSNYYY